jgi:mannose-6-phosphate isomerase-like protein (cupin superfamily)
MKATIEHLDLEQEFETPERCFIIELSNSSDDPAASIARARVAPGVSTRWHRLKDTVERYIILNGKGRVEVDGLAPETVRPGDVVIIPSSCAQRITNIGSEDLIFLAVCTPRFTKGIYEDIDEG